MRVPAAAELIDLWERGRDQNAVERALTLLGATDPLATREQLCALSIGERDRALITLRQALFGTSLRGVSECGQCRAQLEFTLDTRKLTSAAPQENKHEPLELAVGNTRVRFRKPNSHDLLALVTQSDSSSARRVLAERCIVEASSELSEEIIGAIAASLAALDTDAEVLLAMTCAQCGSPAEIDFDIVSFLWSELQSLARQLMEQVHALAWAYGWREQDILSMSAMRRRFYLERVGT